MTVTAEILKILREKYPAMYRFEDSRSVAVHNGICAECKTHIIEGNQFMKSVPPFANTGNKLYDHFLKNQISPIRRHVAEALNTVQAVIVIVTDVYTRVPVVKKKIQDERRLADETALERAGIDITAIEDTYFFTDEYAPPPELIRCSPILIYRGLMYIIKRLAIEFEHNRNILMYVTLPTPKESVIDDIADFIKNFVAVSADHAGLNNPIERAVLAALIANGFDVAKAKGINVRITPALTGPDPDLQFVHGEGETLMWCWVHWLIDRGCVAPAAGKIRLVSVDNDNIIIALMQPPKIANNIIIQQRNVSLAAYEGSGRQPSRKKNYQPDQYPIRRYLDCAALLAAISSSETTHSTDQPHPKCMAVAFMLTMCGTDYCNGIKFVGPAKFARILFSHPKGSTVFFTLSSAAVPTLKENLKNIEEYVIAAVALKGTSDKYHVGIYKIDTYKVPIQMALWQLRYYFNLPRPWPALPRL